jgi:hypothetical protein
VGAFLATGNAEPVRNILAAMGRQEVGDAARMSLAVNAARHDRRRPMAYVKQRAAFSIKSRK